MYAVLKVQTGFCEQKRGIKRVKKDVAMHITVIAVGKLKEKEYVSLCAEYEKRISRFAKMTLKEVSDFDCDADALAVNKEGAEIIKALPKSAYVVVCDPAGAPLSSEGLAEKLTSLGNCGESEVCFVIGGSCGVSDEVRKKADMLLSFSAMTFPHRLFRVMCLEQIYRAFKINANERYHK